MTLVGKSGELLEYLTVSDMEYKAISSQAFSGENEGSTTRVSSLEQKKTPRAPDSLTLW